MKRIGEILAFVAIAAILILGYMLALIDYRVPGGLPRLYNESTVHEQQLEPNDIQHDDAR